MKGFTIRNFAIIGIIALAFGHCVTVAAASTPITGASEQEVPTTQLDITGGPSAFLPGMGRIIGMETPELLIAQRAIDRDLDGGARETQIDTTQYVYVEVDGWKSPVLAGGMSLIVPGSGQLYTGNKYGFLMMGVQAAALYSFFHNKDVSNDLQQEAFDYAGDPNISSSNWSFDRFEEQAGKEEADKLREIFLKDPNEFYSRVSSEPQYFTGWQGSATEQVQNIGNYRQIDEERKDAQRKSQFSLFVALANSAVSMVDAVRQANLNNFRIQENVNLKVTPKTGRNTGLTAVLSHKFF
jgi:hypothetical protein